MKRKDSNCVGILSDQGEAATASDLSEYTICKRFCFVNLHLEDKILFFKAPWDFHA